MKVILIFFLFYCPVSYGQDSELNYEVFHKTDLVGDMKLLSIKEGEKLSIKMRSNVQVDFIFAVVVKSYEESFFEKGRLILSNSKRTVNGKTKLNVQTKSAEKFYYTTDRETTTSREIKRIDYNFLLLYFKEPIGMNEVYSDSFQQFVKIIKIASHHYKITLPDKSYNEYFFQNGVCNRVVVNNTFFKIDMRLKT